MKKNKWMVPLLIVVAVLAVGVLVVWRPAVDAPEAPVVLEPVIEEADVVVVGGGGAGLAAAVTAAEKGATVILLEKMPTLGGNTIISGGVMQAVYPERQEPLGIEDSIDLHIKQTLEGGDNLANPDLVRIMVENAEPALRWLQGMGLELAPEVVAAIGGMWPRAHRNVDPAGTGYIRVLRDAAEEKGVDIRLNTKATGLVVEGGRVVGVEATGAGGEKLLFNALKGVVLATGGFGADIAMRVEQDPTLGADVPTTNQPGATGEGIRMAKEAGANLIGMEHIQLLPIGDPETGALTGAVLAATDMWIFVNEGGKRFVDEGARRDVLVAALLEQTGKKMFTVVDARAVPENRMTFLGENVDDLIAAGSVFTGDTLEEAAVAAGLPVDVLVETVQRYNEGVELGVDEDFGKTLLGSKIEVPPFYISPRKPTVHHTMGGVQIDTYARVIGADGQPIPGFYAAGEVTGGIHGSNRLGANALTDIFVFGRIAGQSAAAGK